MCVVCAMAQRLGRKGVLKLPSDDTLLVLREAGRALDVIQSPHQVDNVGDQNGMS